MSFIGAFAEHAIPVMSKGAQTAVNGALDGSIPTLGKASEKSMEAVGKAAFKNAGKKVAEPGLEAGAKQASALAADRIGYEPKHEPFITHSQLDNLQRFGAGDTSAAHKAARSLIPKNMAAHHGINLNRRTTPTQYEQQIAGYNKVWKSIRP